MPESEEQIRKRIQKKDYDNGDLEYWFRKSEYFSSPLSEDINRAVSTNLPSCCVPLTDLIYKDLDLRTGNLESILKMQEKEILPIIVVRTREGEMWVVDGIHRCRAAECGGKKSIRAVSFQEDQGLRRGIEFRRRMGKRRR